MKSGWRAATNQRAQRASRLQDAAVLTKASYKSDAQLRPISALQECLARRTLELLKSVLQVGRPSYDQSARSKSVSFVGRLVPTEASYKSDALPSFFLGGFFVGLRVVVRTANWWTAMMEFGVPTRLPSFLFLFFKLKKKERKKEKPESLSYRGVTRS